MFCFNKVSLISIDQPFTQPNGLVDVSPTERTLASVTIKSVKNELSSVLLVGEVGWRIVPFVNNQAYGRIEIVIRRNGLQIYKKISDLFVPEDASCSRTCSSFTCFDETSSDGVIKYELKVSGSSDNVDIFRVTGPVNFIAMSLK